MQPATSPAAVTATYHPSQQESSSTPGHLSALPGENFERVLADHISETDNATPTSTVKAATTLQPDFPVRNPAQTEGYLPFSNELKPTHGLPGGPLTKAPRLMLVSKEIAPPRRTEPGNGTNENTSKMTAEPSVGRPGETDGNQASLLPAPKPDVQFDALGLALAPAGAVSAHAVTAGLPPAGGVSTTKDSITEPVPSQATHVYAPGKSDIADSNAGVTQKQADAPAASPVAQAPTGDGSTAASEAIGFSASLVSQPQAAVPPAGRTARGASTINDNGKAQEASDSLESGAVDSAPSVAAAPVPGARPPIGTQPAASVAHQSTHISLPPAIAPSSTPAQATTALDQSSTPNTETGSSASGGRHAFADSSSVPVNPYQKLDQISGAPAPNINIGANRVAVGLHDPALGWVEIKSQSAAGQVAASFVTASSQTHEALTAQLPSLAQFLADHEVRVGSLTVEQQAAGGHGGDPASARHEQGSNSGHPGDGPRAGFNAGPHVTAVEPGMDSSIELRPLSYISVLA